MNNDIKLLPAVAETLNIPFGNTPVKTFSMTGGRVKVKLSLKTYRMLNDSYSFRSNVIYLSSICDDYEEFGKNVKNLIEALDYESAKEVKKGKPFSPTKATIE